ncbi:MAG: hypothetical protein NTU83_05995 [Candidatus Hydrogenedentes bacterium]|nr:hypothetical protein [Candidatus Hydrogenedentota bacterium]
MAWKATVEESITAPEGEYEAEVISVEDKDGQYGPTVRIEFKISAELGGDEFRVAGFAHKKLHEKSKLGRWITAILGHMPEVGEEITIDQLLHKNCRVTVKHKTTTDGKTFANVTDVLPPTIPF